MSKRCSIYSKVKKITVDQSEVLKNQLYRLFRGFLRGGGGGTRHPVLCGDLTGKQPCELIHNNHNQVKLKLVRQKSV